MEINLFVLTEQLMGYMLLLVGGAVLIHAKKWAQVLKDFLSLKKHLLVTIALVSSLVYLPLGLGIVLTHNTWTFSSSVIVTIMGWIVLTKYLVFLFFPEQIEIYKVLFKKGDVFLGWFFRVCGAIYVGLGLWILCPYWL